MTSSRETFHREAREFRAEPVTFRPAFGSADGAYIATGRGFSDALSAGAAAGHLDWPLLLVDPDREVLFLPDQFLGAHVRRKTGRDNVLVWAGECHVHAAINGDQLTDK